MKLLNQIIEESIDRIVSKKVEAKIDETIDQLVITAVKQELEKQIKDRIVVAVKENTSNLDVMLKEMKGLDETLAKYVKKFQNETIEKLKTAIEKLDFKIDLSGVNDNLNQRLGNYMISSVNNSSDFFGRLLSAKVRAHLENTSIFPGEKAKE